MELETGSVATVSSQGKKILYFEWREYILSSENYANPFRISQIILQHVFVRVTRMCKFCFKIILCLNSNMFVVYVTCYYLYYMFLRLVQIWLTHSLLMLVETYISKLKSHSDYSNHKHLIYNTQKLFGEKWISIKIILTVYNYYYLLAFTSSQYMLRTYASATCINSNTEWINLISFNFLLLYTSCYV